MDGGGEGVSPSFADRSQRTNWMQTPAVRYLTLHREIFHLSSINFGAVSAPGVPAAGAARGGCARSRRVPVMMLRCKPSPCSMMCQKQDAREQVGADL